MKKLLWVISLCCLWLSFSTTAEERADYKCYVDTNQGHKVVRFSWYPSKTKLYMARFVGKRMTSDKGSQPLYIKSMLECVNVTQSFNKPQARAVEQRTLS
ncbi:TapY2 family type IVa secretion system protein [Shewanella woodyi]|uniref:Uncharacterized protein n=1 Tax=Shewanella woodyi (strain ATCC 51908 / MS32) TaxID=392500 RepID=B1KJI7_SHEWM|nr:TapY2 family type IVa secretion system protein [Shewanella woodyi]ACA85660.1 conserved hypothetical protein [Shewanella woodyi ATCC 51908]